MNNPIFVYQFYVMDYGWHIFSTIPETVEKLSKEPQEYFLLQDFLAFCDRAKKAEQKADIVGGYCTPIYVMPLIDYIRPTNALIWKAGKGGYCIVVSEIEIPWIENIHSSRKEIFENL